MWWMFLAGFISFPVAVALMLFAALLIIKPRPASYE